MKTTHLISKLLISLMVLYHVYIHLTDKTQTQRYQQNTHNNIHKYFYFIKGTYLFEVVDLYAGSAVLVVMGVGACAMVVSRWWGWKVICILGVIGYNVLIPYFYVLVGNYYAMKQWIGVVAALLYLTVAESEANQNQQLQAKSQQNTTKDPQHNSAQKKVK